MSKLQPESDKGKKDNGHSSEGLGGALIHSQEPWRVENSTDIFTMDRRGDPNDGFQVADAMVDFDADDNPGLDFLTQKANARRIVACVNACAGVSTNDLEMATALHGKVTINPELSLGIAKQRDDLLAALKDMLDYINDSSSEGYIKTKQAIAKCESVQTTE